MLIISYLLFISCFIPFHVKMHKIAKDSDGFWFYSVLGVGKPACLRQARVACLSVSFHSTLQPGLRDNLEGNWGVNLDISKSLVMDGYKTIIAVQLLVSSCIHSSRPQSWQDHHTMPLKLDMTRATAFYFNDFIHHTHTTCRSMAWSKHI